MDHYIDELMERAATLGAEYAYNAAMHGVPLDVTLKNIRSLYSSLKLKQDSILDEGKKYADNR